MPDPNNPFDPSNAAAGIFPAASAIPGRNPAQVSLLAKLLGIQEPDGGVSQEQLQSARNYEQTQDPGVLAQRQLEMTRAQVPLQQTQLQGQNELARTRAEAAGQANVEQMKENAANVARQNFLTQEQQIIPNLPSGSTFTTAGGGTIKTGEGFPQGTAGTAAEKVLTDRLALEKPMGGGFGAMLGYNPLQSQKAAKEQQLDVVAPGWRKRVGPSFPFATPDPGMQSVPGGQPNSNPVQKNPAGVPTAGRLTGKSKSTGAPVYSDDGGKTWFSGQ